MVLVDRIHSWMQLYLVCMKNENMRWNCTLIRMNLMNEKYTMDVFGHMDGMTFMDEIDQHPYILIWLTWPNVTILSDQIHQLKIISSMYWNFIQIVESVFIHVFQFPVMLLKWPYIIAKLVSSKFLIIWK